MPKRERWATVSSNEVLCLRVAQLVEQHGSLRAAAPSPWVKVSERVPEEGVAVLLAHADGRVRQFTWTAEDARWATHWMPLPQAPGEQE